jgi:hypothetical protein
VVALRVKIKGLVFWGLELEVIVTVGFGGDLASCPASLRQGSTCRPVAWEASCLAVPKTTTTPTRRFSSAPNTESLTDASRGRPIGQWPCRDSLSEASGAWLSVASLTPPPIEEDTTGNWI